MASISANGSKGHHKFTLNVTQSATDIATNTSTLSFDFKISPIYNSWDFYGWNQQIAYTLTINGTNYTGYIPDYDGYSVVTLKTGTQSVKHNDDGSKSISFSFSVTDSSGKPYTPGTASANGSMTLSTIPRATTPTFSSKNVTMGNSITITLTPAANTFKHKLRYVWTTLTHQIDGFSTDENFTAQGKLSVTFIPPKSLANYIPSSNSGVCIVQCHTYDASGNHIGTVETEITLAVPDYKPTGSITITGNNLLSEAYVQGKSSMGVSISASSFYGATITGYSSEVDGSTYNGQSFTTGTLSSGSKSVVTDITDSRGRTVQITSPTYTVYAYTAPKITSFSLERQSNGTSVVAKVKGSISAVNNKNAKTIKVVLNGVTNTITSSTYSIDGSTTFTNVPTDVTLIGTVTFADSYVTIKQDSVLPTVAVTMDFLADGTGIAMGKVAELSNTLDVAWKIKNNSIPTLLGGLGEFITNGSNLNTEKHLIPGNYLCPSNDVAKTLVNSPTSIAFKMCVYNCLDVVTDAYTVEWMYIVREITNIDGKTWTQFVRKEGGNWNFGNWCQTLDSAICPDYVTEQGVSGIWTYRKWNSGVSECWGHIYLGDNISLSTSMAGGVYSNNSYNARGENLPSGLFTGGPVVSINVTSNGYTLAQVASATNTQVIYRIWSPYNTTISGVFVSIRCEGRWK